MDGGRPASAALALICWLSAATPGLAQPRAEIDPPAAVGHTGATTTLTVVVATDPDQLGSYAASVDWDPLAVVFSGWRGGRPPFDGPTVNASLAVAGEVRFSDADPFGAPGPRLVFELDLDVLADPPAIVPLDLEFDSMFSAELFDDLLPGLQIVDGSICVGDYLYDLRVSDPAATVMSWTPVPGAQRYDVIRSDLEELTSDGAAIHLGAVLCLENDSADATTGDGSEPANPDTAIPDRGRGFAYLVRTDAGVTTRTYGFFSDCIGERVADSGDCP